MELSTIEQQSLNYLFETDNLCMVDDTIYFSAKNYDALVMIDLKTHIATIEKCFLDKYNTSYCAHSKIIHYNHNIFCIPRYSRDIIKYDLFTKQTSKIKIPNIKSNKSIFNEAVQIDNRIICFPEFYEGIVIIDMNSNEISAIKELKNDMPNKYLFVSNAVKSGDEFLIPFYNKNKILKFNTIHNEICEIDLQANSCGFTSIICLKDKIYLMGTNGVLYIYSNKEELIAVQENLNGILYMIDNSIWLVDTINNNIYIMDFLKLRMEQYIVNDNYTEIINNSKWIKSELIDGFIYILLKRENLEMGILVCNLKEVYYIPIYVDILCEDLYKNKFFFEEHFEVSLLVFKNILSKTISVENKASNIGAKIFITTKGINK